MFHSPKGTQNTLTNINRRHFHPIYSAVGKFTSAGAVGKFTKKPIVTRKPILDARNKIIQKNRAKIHDARDKLAQIAKRSGDARLKLLKKNINSLKKLGEYDAALDAVSRATGPANPKKRLANTAPTAAPTTALFSRANAKKDMDMDVDMEYYPSANSLRRTVKNDISYAPASTMPPLPTFEKYMLQSKRYPEAKRPTVGYSEPDPFDCYEVPVARPYDVSEPRNLSRSVHEAHMDEYPRKGILRSTGGNGIGASMGYERSMASAPFRNDASRRYIADENSHLSSEMRTRLQRAPTTNQSAGIFSNPYAAGAREPMNKISSSQGYRIVVSNLHGSVSQSDIKELFEDVGPLLDARLVRTGVAEVIFEKLADAQTAVDTYHNRQLDGQPMKCLLVNPRSSNKPTAPAMKPTRRYVESKKASCF